MDIREVSTGTTDTPTTADAGKMIEVTSTDGDMAIGLTAEATGGWDGELLHFYRDTDNEVDIAPDPGVTIELPNGQTVDSTGSVRLETRGDTASMRHRGTGTDAWVVIGEPRGLVSVPAVATGTSLTIGAAHANALVRCSDTSPIEVEFVEDADIPVGASGEIVQWGNGALSCAGTAVVLVSLDGDLTLSGLYASIVWTKLDATTYLIRGALAVETRGLVSIPADPAGAISSVRVASGYEMLLTDGPIVGTEATATLTAGVYYLARQAISARVFTTARIRLDTAGSSGDEFYVVVYEIASDGLPGELVESIGPFDGYNGGAAGILQLTGLSGSIPADGVFYVGLLADDTNTGSPAVSTMRSGLPIAASTTAASQWERVLSLQSNLNDAAPASDLTSESPWSPSSADQVVPYVLLG